jgi:hypothetical protein
MSNNKFRSIADVYTTGTTYRYIEPQPGPVKNLTQAYSFVNEAKKTEGVPVFRNNEWDTSVIEKISGVDGNIMLQYMGHLKQAGKEGWVKKQTITAVGNPQDRAIDKTLQGKPYKELYKFINASLKEYSKDDADKKFIVTTAAGVKKLRTPLGARVCEWDGSKIVMLTGALLRPDLLDNTIERISKMAGGVELLRCLQILYLLQEWPDKFVQLDKSPPGIAYELMQIEAFNKDLKDLPPLYLKLPNDTDNYKDPNLGIIKIDGATEIKGTPKADFALSNNGKEVFWVSYKHGEYKEDITRPDDIPFQQYGSPKKGIYKDKKLQSLVDEFLTEAVAEMRSFYSRDDVIQKGDESQPDGSLLNVMGYYQHRVIPQSRTKLKDTDITRFHIMIGKGGGTDKHPEFASHLFDADHRPFKTEANMIALKAIYGDNYGKVDKFGKQNVNVLLQTPKSATFKVVHNNEGDPDHAEMIMPDDSHLIKNPDLPESGPYLPCLYGRYSKAEYFIFNNKNTKKKEAILGCRILVFPQGRVSPHARWLDLF